MVKLFVEGKADRKFLQDLIFYVFGNRLEKNRFVIVESNTRKALEDRTEQFKRNTEKEGPSLLIFDADSNYQDTLGRLTDIRAELGIEFVPFLFPNNADDGTLETLLARIINPRNELIFECFEEYQKCLKQDDRFKVPAAKTKIFAYTDALLPKRDEKFAKEEFRDYLNTDHWDLDSDALLPLREFLSPHFNG